MIWPLKRVPLTTQLFCCCLCLCCFWSCKAQNITPLVVTNLDGGLGETSGLITYNNHLFTHNDSGDGPFLYEADTSNGQILRTVFVENVGQVDWEDIALDASYLYVGDFGNNNGTRTDLKVYRILLMDLQNSDTVQADTISFNYADQTNFNSNPFFTNYDAEALIAFGDSLYIFSKSWGSQQSILYPLPKLPGNYSLVKTDSIQSQGLVTGADYNPQTGEVWLVGYGLFTQFLVRITDFQGPSLANSTVIRYGFQPPAATQVEGICVLDSNQYYVSAESGGGSPAVLYRFTTPILTSRPEALPDLLFWPNPVTTVLKFQEQVKLFVLLDLQGRPLLQGTKMVSLEGLKPGTYILEMFDAFGRMMGRDKVVVR